MDTKIKISVLNDHYNGSGMNLRTKVKYRNMF